MRMGEAGEGGADAWWAILVKVIWCCQERVGGGLKKDFFS
jgi:hypothetical protein